MKINLVICNSNQMDSLSSSDATQKRIVLTLNNKLKVCEMVRKKVQQSPKTLKKAMFNKLDK